MLTEGSSLPPAFDRITETISTMLEQLIIVSGGVPRLTTGRLGLERPVSRWSYRRVRSREASI
jgi:hypothetical protein